MATINLGRVAYVNRGAYNPATTYEKYDVVLYNNGSYVYIGDAALSGKTPTDTGYWQAMLDPTAMNEAAAIAKTAAEPIIFNEAGEIIAVDNAANRVPLVLNLYGRTTQAATPTPSAPQDLESKSGVEVKVCDKNIFDVFGDNINIGRNGTAQSGNNPNVANADGSITINIAAASTYGLGFKKRLAAGVTVSISFDVLSIGNGTSVGFVVWETPAVKQHISDRVAVGHYANQFTAQNDGEYMFGWMVRDGSNPCGGVITNVQLEIGGAATEFEPHIDAGTLSFSDILPGIPVSSNGNHIDSNGQHWVADFIDIPGKCLNTLVGSFTLDGSEGYEWSIDSGSGISVAYIGPQDKWGAHDATLVNDTRLISTHFVGGLLTDVGQIKMDSNFLNMSVPSSITTSAGMNAWLAANPVTVLYVRGEYIYTAIELDNVVLPSPNATVYNDSGCSIHLAYIADTKTYVDQKCAESVEKARVGKADEFECEASGPVAVIADAAARPVVSLVSNIIPAQAGSGDPSPDNVRPISGRGEASVRRTGRNMLYRDTEDVMDMSLINSSGTVISRKGYLVELPAGNYVAKAEFKGTATRMYITGLIVGPDSKHTGKPSLALIDDTKVSTLHFTLEPGEKLAVYNSSTTQSVTQTKELLDLINLYIFLDDGNTENEEYEGQALTADLPETVYGGTLDWTTGVLTVNWKAVDLGGLAWAMKDNNHFYTSAAYKTADGRPGGDMICSHYVTSTAASAAIGQNTLPDKSIWANGWAFSATNLVIKDTSYSDVESFKTSLAGVMLAFKTNDTHIIQLTPQQLSLLKGTNNVWSDCGGDTSLVYIADTKLYIDQKFAALAAAIVNN